MYRECIGHRVAHATRDNYYLLPIQNEISYVALPNCCLCQRHSVWSGMPAASLSLLCICSCAACIPLLHSRHSHHRCPLCVQAGSGTRHQLQSSSSPGCAPCLLSPAVTTTDPGAYIRKQNCLYSDPEGQTGSFIVIQSKPG